MTRIAEQEIDRLKQEISLERLLESQGIKLKRHGQNLLGHCPFHDDKTPSRHPKTSGTASEPVKRAAV